MTPTPQPRVTADEVRRIAKLSRLKLQDQEVASATKNLSNILGNFSAIQAIDTKDVPLALDASGLTNVTRADAAADNVLGSHEALLKRAPATNRGQFTVRAVFAD